jgi:transcriptional activator HAC1
MSELKRELDVSQTSFKSSLPPRKRAKTKEEKEQRRVERILRNRRAAHASREKKRKHVEYLENYVVQLEQNLSKLQQNFDSCFQHLDDSTKASLSLHKLSDISELKSKIHANLSREIAESGDAGDANGVENDNDLCSSSQDDQPNYKLDSKDSVDSDSNSNSTGSTEDTSALSIQPDSTFFNYLSPISINSPIHTPIDLTLTNKLDGMEQNSAAPTIQFDFNSQEEDQDNVMNWNYETTDYKLDLEEFLTL